MTTPDAQPSTRNPVRVFNAVFVGLQFLLGSSLLTEIVGAKIIGLLMLIVGAVNLGVGEYVRGQVTPSANVVAQRTDAGTVIAGPSAQTPTGVEVDEPTPVEPA